MDNRLLIATTNSGKLREVHALLADQPLRVASLTDFPDILEPNEDGGALEENARLKAMYYAERTGLWTLADDSGLEVDALNGEPGVRSARYAGETADDGANNAKLIAALAVVPPDRRNARFRCVMVLARPGCVVCTSQGVIEGYIVDHACGSNGFGYDPHFFVPEYGQTTAEMPPGLKNRISHRAHALRGIIPQILRHVLASDAKTGPPGGWKTV